MTECICDSPDRHHATYCWANEWRTTADQAA